MESNNKFAIDALLEGYELEHYLDCVNANPFIIKNIFNIFSIYRRNEIYEKTQRVLFGFLIKVYMSSEDGYRIYQPTIPDVNNVGKILDDTKDQDDYLNRDILDILLFFSDLDAHYETDPNRKEIARQAGRIRSDFFDSTRNLNQSITDTMLAKAKENSLGMSPKYVYVDD